MLHLFAFDPFEWLDGVIPAREQVAAIVRVLLDPNDSSGDPTIEPGGVYTHQNGQFSDRYLARAILTDTESAHWTPVAD
ncbi:MAG: hypothetical protein ABSF26_30875 [Thermoguttaceae bacterium]|jgi:hypothetical protein